MRKKRLLGSSSDGEKEKRKRSFEGQWVQSVGRAAGLGINQTTVLPRSQPQFGIIPRPMLLKHHLKAEWSHIGRPDATSKLNTARLFPQPAHEVVSREFFVCGWFAPPEPNAKGFTGSILPKASISGYGPISRAV